MKKIDKDYFTILLRLVLLLGVSACLECDECDSTIECPTAVSAGKIPVSIRIRPDPTPMETRKGMRMAMRTAMRTATLTRACGRRRRSVYVSNPPPGM